MLVHILDAIHDYWIWTMGNIFYINLLLSILIIFFQRRDPKTVWTWLLVLYFIPILGFFLYLLIGQDIHKIKMFKTKEIEDELNSAIRKQEETIFRNEFQVSDPLLENYSDLILYNLETSGAIYAEDNDITVYTDGEQKFQALMDEIKKAEKFIHIQYYIIRDDELLRRIEIPLIEKAKQGVEVRILYDGMGGRGLKKKTLDKYKKEGIKTGEFFPAVMKRLHLRINYRNHRKIVVIDGKIGFIGGFNIGKEYLGLKKKFGYWRDTHLKITGSAVSDLQLRFVLDWNYATKENLFQDEKYFHTNVDLPADKNGVQIISSGPDSKRQVIHDNFVRLIHKAKKNIYIQTPYFIPDEPVLEALKIASMSGVDVKIMIPCKPDHPFVYWATYSYVGEMLDSRIQCYIYNNGFLHAKGITIDGLVCSYGTANMDIRSFILNFEVNAVIYNSEKTRELESVFLKDLSLCTEITKFDYDRRSLIVRAKEQVCRLLSPLM